MITLESTPLKDLLLDWDVLKDQVIRAVMHDFNNLMGGVCVVGDFYAMNAGSQEEVQQAFQDIKQESLKTNVLVRKLFQILTQEEVVSDSCNVCEVLEELKPIMEAVVPKFCELRLEFKDKEQIVNVSRVYLERAVLVVLVKLIGVLNKNDQVNVVLSGNELSFYVLNNYNDFKFLSIWI